MSVVTLVTTEIAKPWLRWTELNPRMPGHLKRLKILKALAGMGGNSPDMPIFKILRLIRPCQTMSDHVRVPYVPGDGCVVYDIYIYICMASTAYTACYDGNWLRAKWRCHEIVKVPPWRIRRGHPGGSADGVLDGHGIRPKMSQVWKRWAPNPPRSSITRHPKLQISPAEEFCKNSDVICIYLSHICHFLSASKRMLELLACSSEARVGQNLPEMERLGTQNQELNLVRICLNHSEIMTISKIYSKIQKSFILKF